MEINENAQLSGTLEVAAIRASTGLLIDWWREENLIVSSAREMLARLISGDGAGDSITHIGFGTGAAPATPNDTNLTAAHWRPLSGHSYPAPGKVQFSFSLSTTEANGLTIRELGLRTSSGALFSGRLEAESRRTTISALKAPGPLRFKRGTPWQT